MSDEFYPLSGFSAIRSKPFNRVLKDEFDDGTINAQRLWPDGYFKRIIEADHMPLTDEEAIYLREFYGARNGTFDTFWFRDNVNREGNYQVRFRDDVDYSRQTAATEVKIALEQVSATRKRPSLPGIATALGIASSDIKFWHDANRQKYWTHLGVETIESSWINSGYLKNHPALYAAGFSPHSQQFALDSTKAQNAMLIGTSYFYRTAASFTASEISAVSPNPSGVMFCLCRMTTHSAKRVIMGMGSVSAGGAVGIAIAADNRFEPWLGGSETYTNARFQNSAAFTWRSVAAYFSGTTVKLYVNGALIGTDTGLTRNWATGRFSIGCAPDLTLPPTGGNLCQIQHPIWLGGAYGDSFMAALHNYFAPDFGLATV